jgi:YfiH family protein
MWLTSPLIDAVHGFSDRHGGVSGAPFDTLNLGGSEDEPGAIANNRSRALAALGLSNENLCLLKQVHGNAVAVAAPGRQDGDAIVTDRKNLVLAVNVADCFPILLEDRDAGVVAAVHSGWRGTVARIASGTVRRMTELGARADRIRTAIGQGISRDRFEVGPEVTEAFRKAGFSERLLSGGKIDLAGCIISDLAAAGIREDHIWNMSRCTYESDFFSFRRDKGRTGRMWGLIAT